MSLFVFDFGLVLLVIIEIFLFGVLVLVVGFIDFFVGLFVVFVGGLIIFFIVVNVNDLLWRRNVVNEIYEKVFEKK